METGIKILISQIKLEQKNKIREKTGQKTIERTKRGEVKILMGIKDDKTIDPFGAWTSESWKKCGKMILKSNNPNKKVALKKLANVIIEDGKIGLDNGLGILAHHHQRCF